MDRTIPLTLLWDETFDIGPDTETPVDDHDYQVPFNFTGKIDKLTITVERPIDARRQKMTDAGKCKCGRRSVG